MIQKQIHYRSLAFPSCHLYYTPRYLNICFKIEVNETKVNLQFNDILPFSLQFFTLLALDYIFRSSINLESSKFGNQLKHSVAFQFLWSIPLGLVRISLFPSNAMSAHSSKTSISTLNGNILINLKTSQLGHGVEFLIVGSIQYLNQYES